MGRRGLLPRDVGLLLLLCALLMGWGAVCGRPFSLHEARLPQLSSEIFQGKSSLLLPLSAGRPWLERPPLPHWFTSGSMFLFGRTHPEWVARLPAALAGTCTVLLGAWIAGMLFGRSMGLLSGVVIATCYELYNYSTLAEDDIYLAMVVAATMAMFVKADTSSRAYKSIFSWRSWPFVWMFLFLGLTNWAKGPLVGAAPIVGTVGVYLLWNRDFSRFRRYFWVWGLLLTAALTVAWPLIAMHRYPDVWDNWRYDYTSYSGSVREGEYDEPFWYYVAMMPMTLAPWILTVIPGMVVTARRAFKVRYSAERFIWCWALMGLIVLSIPSRKHHHYFVPVVIPWAILAAHGLIPVAKLLFSGKGPEWSRRPLVGLLMAGAPGVAVILLLHKKFPGPALGPSVLAGAWLLCVWLFYLGQWRKSAHLVLAAFLVGFIVVAGWLQGWVVARDRTTLAEMAFLRQVRSAVPEGQLLTVNARISPLEFFRVQYYLPESVHLLHNLSYLKSDRIKAPSVYVITRAVDEEKLKQLGQVEQVAQAAASVSQKTPADRYTLYRLTFSPTLERYPEPPYVGVMQAMGRRPGPWCGPEWQ